MTVTLTLPAPPEPCLATGLPPATPGTVHGSGWRHRVVAIASGLGGLTAMKALKHDLVDITDAVVFLPRIAARGTAHVHNQTSLWLYVIPTTAAVLTTVGVLITLYAAIIRERKRSRHYDIVTATEYFSCHRLLWRSRRTRKGWC